MSVVKGAAPSLKSLLNELFKQATCIRAVYVVFAFSPVMVHLRFPMSAQLPPMLVQFVVRAYPDGVWPTTPITKYESLSH